MKKGDLKNKLDQKPISFDRENLWDRIEEQSNKKRRRPIFWWFFGAGIFALILMVFIDVFNSKPEFLFNDRTTEKTLSKSIAFGKNETETEKASSLQNSEGNSEEKSELEFSNSKDIENTKEVVNLQELQNEIKLTQQEGVSSAKKTNFFNDQNGSSIADENLLLKNELRNGSNIESNNAFAAESKKNKDAINENPVTRNIELISISSIKGISLHPLVIENELIFSLKKPESFILASKLFRPKNEVLIGIGIGSDMHAFKQQDVFNRFNIENNLESISANLFYKRYLNHNFLVSVGIGFMSSQTQVVDAQLNPNQYIRSFQDGNTYEIISETKRRLYNRYSRVDLCLGFEYILNLDAWQFRPGLGLGFNGKSFSSGMVITNNNEVIALDNLDAYKDRIGSFYYYGLNIDRSLHESVRIGLGMMFQNRRDLTIQKDEHIVRPMHLTFFISKQW